MESLTPAKRRGRKKKVETPDGETEPTQAAEGGESAPTANKQPAKRGRKSKAIVGSYSANENTQTNLSDDENVIVQLNVKGPGETADAPLSQLPKAYDNPNSFSSTPMEVSHHPSISSAKSAPWSSLKVVELLKDFEMKSKASEWPVTTSIACYWCCHKFNTVPFGIPVKFYKEKFHVFGCFCSLECAAAYNFNFAESQDETWERYNLINLLSRKLGHVNRVKPAPNRLALKMFGGHMEIEDFRRFTVTQKVLNVNFPPMMTLTQQIEELNECDVSSEYRYIPLDHERINKYKEKLTLRRTKPVTEFKHTLDHMMNLKIQS